MWVLGSVLTIRRRRRAFVLSLNSQKVFPDRSEPVEIPTGLDRWLYRGVMGACQLGRIFATEVEGLSTLTTSSSPDPLMPRRVG